MVVTTKTNGGDPIEEAKALIEEMARKSGRQGTSTKEVGEIWKDLGDRLRETVSGTEDKEG